MYVIQKFDEINNKVNANLEVWRQTLECKRFKLSKVKTKYLKSKFSDAASEVDMKVRLNDQSHFLERVFQVLKVSNSR